jgi:hypothetical protein
MLRQSTLLLPVLRPRLNQAHPNLLLNRGHVLQQVEGSQSKPRQRTAKWRLVRLLRPRCGVCMHAFIHVHVYSEALKEFSKNILPGKEQLTSSFQPTHVHTLHS